MYPVSNAFLEAVKANNRKYYWTGRITTTAGTVCEFDQDDMIKGSGYITSQCCGSTVIDLNYQMYLKAKISYEHDIRVEEYPFAREAIREAVYNAIAHNCYMYGTPIQIRVMDDVITISNSCILPEGWTVDTLMELHESKPYNPDIARVFYRAGFIENWGQGIQKICDECKGIGAELPVYELTGTTITDSVQGTGKCPYRSAKSTKAPKHG